ncbi:MAG: methylisocitrate lyase, partial [Chloroflexi bacterium]|nr:methylisocitrate lyase [Chloroflexota bacterium]
PLVPAHELGAMGYKVVGFSGTAVGAAARAVERALKTLLDQGTTASVLGDVMTLPERNRLLGLEAYQALEAETVVEE